MSKKIIVFISLFFSLVFIGTKSFSKEHFVAHSTISRNFISDTTLIDSSIVTYNVFYNSDSAHNKGVTKKWKRRLWGGLPLYGVGLLIVAASIIEKNQKLSQSLAVTSLGIVAVGGGTFLRDANINDAEKSNLFLGKTLDQIKSTYGPKVNYKMIKRGNSEFLNFRFTETEVSQGFQKLNNGTVQSKTSKTYKKKEFEVYFDESGKANFARFRYYKKRNSGWRESKRI